MLNGAFGSAKSLVSHILRIPFVGLSNSAQLTANNTCGIIIGITDTILKRNLKGISVRLFRYARKIANTVANSAEPNTNAAVSPRMSMSIGSV